MIKSLINIFKRKSPEKKPKYKGFSDFFMHATDEEKKAVLLEAAKRANADQLETVRKARLLIKQN